MSSHRHGLPEGHDLADVRLDILQGRMGNGINVEVAFPKGLYRLLCRAAASRVGAAVVLLGVQGGLSPAGLLLHTSASVVRMSRSVAA